MKNSWLVLSSLSACVLVAPPAYAGKLVSWQFDANQNRLVFRTETGVQPRAKLIANPTRVVVDLPGTTLGHAMVERSVGQTIRKVRVGQFDSNTTRFVVELASGYTLDPQQIRVRGASANQWSVQLPTPERPQPQSRSSLLNASPPPTPGTLTAAPVRQENDYFKITQNGFLLALSEAAEDLEVSRSRDRRQIDIELEGVTLPSALQGTSQAIETYGVSHIEFGEGDTARLQLHVSPDSPDWQVLSSSRSTNLVILPRGGMSLVRNLSSPQAPVAVAESETEEPTPAASADLATIGAIELGGSNSLLAIRSDRRVAARGTWQSGGIYEVTIANARLAEPFRGPQLDRNSPVTRVRVRQQDETTVVVQVQPATGVNLGRLVQPTSEILALELLDSRVATVPEVRTIQVPPPERLTPSYSTSSSTRNAPQEVALVVVDPGHGGKDPGAIGIGGLQEKHVVLPISHQVREILESQGVAVRMTRTDDRFISLAGRSQLANRLDADLFVSIHANAISLSRPDVNGVETFYYSSGRRLAQSIQSSILRRVQMRNRGVKQANFYVLRNSAMPAVLVEVGFVTGREDAPRLANADFRRQMAEAIAEGILQYIRQTQ